MVYRGRLIFPIVARIYRLDLVAINTASNFDTVYQEIKKTSTSDGRGATARLEMSPTDVPIQFEPHQFNRIMQLANGDGGNTRVVGVMHFLDLEAAGLVNGTTGEALLKKNDRLGALYNIDGTLIQTVETSPGITIVELLPIMGFGGRGTRNLLQVTFESRQSGLGR